MRRRIINIVIIMISLFLFNTSIVNAGSIEEMNIEVTLDKEGNAYFTETWKMNVTSGTEVYKPIYNLKNETVSNFSASRDGENLNIVDSWDVDKSREEKASIAGINYVDEGIELCFGIGNYGKHTFVIKYKVNNFITAFKGADASLWQYVGPGFSDSIEKININVYSYEPLADDFPIWAYGTKGYYYVENGHVHFETDRELDKNEYVVLLLQFNPETFITSNISEKTFDDVLNEANEGTFEYDYDDDDDEGILDDIFSVFSAVIFTVISSIVGIKASKNYKSKVNYDYGKKGIVISKEEAVYYRDIPFKDIIDGYYVSDVFKLNKNDTDLIGALILKWLKEKQIKIEDVNEEKERKYIFILDKVFKGSNEHEKKLYSMFIQASHDHKLHSSDFSSWVMSNYSQIERWFKSIDESELDKFVQNNKLVLLNKGSIFTKPLYEVTDEFRKDAVKLAGLKNFINDFTILKERKTLEVFAFEDYLIYAQLFGVAKEAVKSFKKIYPELAKDNNPYFDIYMYSYISDFSNTTASAVNKAKEKASNYSGGGGGFSVGGGGGGFSGGGFGGGSR